MLHGLVASDKRDPVVLALDGLNEDLLESKRRPRVGVFDEWAGWNGLIHSHQLATSHTKIALVDRPLHPCSQPRYSTCIKGILGRKFIVTHGRKCICRSGFSVAVFLDGRQNGVFSGIH